MTARDRLRRVARLLRALAGLPRSEALTVAAAGLLLVWYRLRMALPAPLAWRRGLLRGALADPIAFAGRTERWPRPAARASVPRIGELFGVAVAHAPVGTPCLVRSLALARLLRASGHGCRVRVGLRRASGRLAGHAWVEHDRAVVCDRGEFVRSFVPFGCARSSRVEEIG